MDEFESMTAAQVRADIDFVEELVRKAEEEGSADSLAAKQLFFRTLRRLREQLSRLEQQV